MERGNQIAMNRDFVHLHLHTEYSLLDGFTRIDSLADRLKELGMESVAITDHGVMFGVVNFYKKMKAAGIKPIIGCEVYVAARTRFDRDQALDRHSGHLVLLVKNHIGYKNLIHLVTLAYKEGFYRKPRIDYDILGKHSEGLVILSSCLHGDIQSSLAEGDYEKAKSIALNLSEIADDSSFYLELQDHGMDIQKKVNLQLVRLSKDIGVPLVCTNDVHYITRDDSYAHDALLCIQTGKNISDSDRMRFPASEFYLKSYDEMAELFRYAPEALENTVKIADMCDFDFEFGVHHLPKYIFTKEEKALGISPAQYLKLLCDKGMGIKYGNHITEACVSRLEYELGVISEMGYEDYFLIVWDFIRYAKDCGIFVGPGRGSCGGSIVAYSLGITDVDPIKYDLIFERFLNPERITMPDIDIDFEDSRRSEVIDYVVAKYGIDHVAQIITFGTLGAKAAIRDVGRVMGIPYAKVDHIAKEIPFMLGMTIDKALAMNKALKSLCDDDPVTAQVIDLARKLEGVPRHSSTHAAGVVISADTVDSYVPLIVQDMTLTTQYDMTLLEELGLLKMDFLGLRTLTVIKDSLRSINQDSDMGIELADIPFDDSKTFDMISRGSTLGLFQLESPGMRRFMAELKPRSLEDIIAGISLYRPGPMDSIPRYISNKNNPEAITFKHDRLRDILGVTYGCIVYQEQVMRIVRELAGYSFARSDLVRRAMSKKKMDVMEEERRAFIYGVADETGKVEIEGCVRRGIPADIASDIFDEMTDFAKYAFNKSHAAGYAILAYQTAWLKANYAPHFMAALMTSMMSSHGKLAQYMDEVNILGIRIMPPSVNDSDETFKVEDGNIRYGLLAIKNVGISAIRALMDERRKNGHFKSFIDFLERLADKDMNKRVIESLVKSGAFDSLGVTRQEIILNYEHLFDIILSDARKKQNGQLSLFESGSSDKMYSMIRSEEYPERVKLAFEREMLGVYISGHPLMEIRDMVDEYNTVIFSDMLELADGDDRTLLDAYDGRKVRFYVLITKVVTKITKTGATMAFLNVEDLTGSLEVIVFPNVFAKSRHLIKEDAFVSVRGAISVRDEDPPKVIADDIGAVDRKVKSIYLRYASTDTIDYDFLRNLARGHHGKSRVIVFSQRENAKKSLGPEFGMSISDELVAALQNEIGKENVVIK